MSPAQQQQQQQTIDSFIQSTVQNDGRKGAGGGKWWVRPSCGCARNPVLSNATANSSCTVLFPAPWCGVVWCVVVCCGVVWCVLTHRTTRACDPPRHRWDRSACRSGKRPPRLGPDIPHELLRVRVPLFALFFAQKKTRPWCRCCCCCWGRNIGLHRVHPGKEKEPEPSLWLVRACMHA